MGESTATACATVVIGDVAGRVWQCLDKNGREMSTARVVREVGAPREVVQRAVGWLAREDKVEIMAADGKEVLRLK